MGKRTILITICTVSLLISLTYQACSISNSLTTQQNLALKNFTSAGYIPSTQQLNLRKAYSSLNRKLDNYLIELQSSYLFDVNDIEQCTNIPSYVTYNSMDNVWICLNSPVLVLECNKEWELKIGCGTFIELHKPFDTQVISKISLKQSLVSVPFSMTLVNLCAGTYHLWFVYSARVGKVIKNVKSIFVSYPSCDCS